MSYGNSSLMILPTEPQEVTPDQKPSPLAARVSLLGPPKIGKTTLAANWSPKTTLFIDLQHGTDLLPGKHYVKHVTNWTEFEQTCTAVAAGGHNFETVVIDTIDQAWKFADLHAATRFGEVAAGAVDFGKATSIAEGLFRKSIGQLLARRGMGIWFVGHTRLEEIDKKKQHVPRIHDKVKDFIAGECEHIFFAAKAGNKNVLHTKATADYEAGSRLPLPSPIDLDAKKLYLAMQAGIDELAGTGESITDGKDPA